MTTKGFLGIDAGTQGLAVVFTNEGLEVLATGDGHYEMVAGLAEGCYEQNPADWLAALRDAMADLRSKLSGEIEVLAIGISGQMHGEVLCDKNGEPLGPARLWCDSRNEKEERELTEKLGVKMPKRITAARWLWTVRNQPDKAKQVRHITTPAGWLAFKLTGQWNLGIGDASGMFPVDQKTLAYDQSKLSKFESIVPESSVASLQEMLPAIRKAGEDAGSLNEFGAETLALTAGITVAAAEGDQPAALAGSLISDAGSVSVSFGTSVCANSVGDRAFAGVDSAIDHFCAVDGKPINMVFLRNGTTYMNSVIEMFGCAIEGDRAAAFSKIMPLVESASADCGGLLALPFVDDEPGLGVNRGGTAMLIGLNSENATPGNSVKAALVATMFNLKSGSEVLEQQEFPRNELVLTGGLTKTPELAQVLADVFNTPVKLLESAEEGTAWGAALLAKFRHEKQQDATDVWAKFVLRERDALLKGQGRAMSREFMPKADQVSIYAAMYARYKKLLATQATLQEAIE